MLLTRFKAAVQCNFSLHVRRLASLPQLRRDVQEADVDVHPVQEKPCIHEEGIGWEDLGKFNNQVKDASVQAKLSAAGGWKDWHEVNASECGGQQKQRDGSGQIFEKKFALSKDRWPDFYLERLDMDLLGKSRAFRNPPNYMELVTLRQKIGLPEWPEFEEPRMQEYAGEECEVVTHPPTHVELEVQRRTERPRSDISSAGVGTGKA